MLREFGFLSVVGLMACSSSTESPDGGDVIPHESEGGSEGAAPKPLVDGSADAGDAGGAAVVFCPPLMPGCQVQVASDGGPTPSLDSGTLTDASTGTPTVIGTWVTGSAQESIWLTLNADGTYRFAILIPTSTVTTDVFIQDGNFAVTGISIVLAPTEESCPFTAPASPSTSTYFFDGDALVTYDSSGKQTVYGRAPSAPDLSGASDLTDAGLNSDGGTTLVLGCPVTPFTAYPMTGTPPASSNPGTIPTPYGSWVVANSDDTVAVQVLLNSDLTYEISLLIVTSTVSADEYTQKGTFVISGTNLVFTPTEASCPGNVPVFTNGYVYDQDLLVLQNPTTGNTTTLATDPTLMLGQGLTVVLGCSLDNGPWMPYALSAVQN
jgi:hypothetical protein